MFEKGKGGSDPGIILQGEVGEILSLNCLTSPFFLVEGEVFHYRYKTEFLEKMVYFLKLLVKTSPYFEGLA
ncbi:MAG: hypothetical protein ABW185_08410 [Sedimenticola sp.]